MPQTITYYTWEVIIIINDYLEKYYIKKIKEQKYAPKDYWYASTIGDCGRKIYYARKGTKPSNELDVTAYLRCSMGNIRHENFAHDLTDAGLVTVNGIEREVFDKKLNIKGRIDVIIKGDIPVEFKTTSEYSFKSIPKELHIIQVLFYMYCLKTKEGYLIYENKSSNHRKEFKITWNKNTRKLFRNIKNKLQHLENLIKNNSVPERESISIAETKCRYCDYKDRCWKEK